VATRKRGVRKLKTTREAGHIKKGSIRKSGVASKLLAVGELSIERLGVAIGAMQAGALQVQYDDVQRKTNESAIRGYNSEIMQETLQDFLSALNVMTSLK